jgi:hypothetical protein
MVNEDIKVRRRALLGAFCVKLSNEFYKQNRSWYNCFNKNYLRCRDYDEKINFNFKGLTMAGNIQTSFVKRTRDAKMNAGIAAIATRLAKENNDILFKKSSRAKRMFMSSKMQILK